MVEVVEDRRPMSRAERAAAIGASTARPRLVATGAEAIAVIPIDGVLGKRLSFVEELARIATEPALGSGE